MTIEKQSLRELLINHYKDIIIKDYKFKMGDDDYEPSSMKELANIISNARIIANSFIEDGS